MSVFLFNIVLERRNSKGKLFNFSFRGEPMRKWFTVSKNYKLYDLNSYTKLLGRLYQRERLG